MTLEALRTRQMRSLAIALGLDVGRMPEAGQVDAAIREKLETSGQYLWVVDDVPHDVTGAMVRRWQAPTSKGRTLITIRNQ